MDRSLVALIEIKACAGTAATINADILTKNIPFAGRWDNGYV